MITCEYTAHGNTCPDVSCILDHTLVISQEKKVRVLDYQFVLDYDQLPPHLRLQDRMYLRNRRQERPSFERPE